MSISNIDNFVNDLYIPLAKGTISGTANTETPNSRAYVLELIDEVEKDVLLNALGLDLYNELMAALVDLPSADQKWRDLVNGVEYNGKIWEGLDNAKSLFLYAVYTLFIMENSDFLTALGVAKSNVENANLTTNTTKVSYAWQKFLTKYQNGCLAEPLIYSDSGSNFIDYYGTNDNIQRSLYQYLNDNLTTWDTWDNSKFRLYEQMNSFGI
tara:strand:+ start:2742 stop:3374 length:633 start_codon:yes stop_codon:yes gene_type:complete